MYTAIVMAKINTKIKITFTLIKSIVVENYKMESIVIAIEICLV